MFLEFSTEISQDTHSNGPEYTKLHCKNQWCDRLKLSCQKILLCEDSNIHIKWNIRGNNWAYSTYSLTTCSSLFSDCKHSYWKGRGKERRRNSSLSIWPFCHCSFQIEALGAEDIHYMLVFKGAMYKKALLDYLQNYCFAANSLQQIVIAKGFNEHVLSVIKFEDSSAKFGSIKMLIKKG